jgi:hypothetical protein
MSSLIKNLHIQNFKSVRDLRLECERINIFIGKPNAGKSNILEAISLLGANFSGGMPGKFCGPTLRYKSINHLFSNFNSRSPIEISANTEFLAVLKQNQNNENFIFQISSPNPSPTNTEVEGLFIPSLTYDIAENGDVKGMGSPISHKVVSCVKRYDFQGIIEGTKNGFHLNPPHGDNFYSIIETSPNLQYEIQQFLKPNGLEFLLDVERQRMAVVQKTETALLSFPLHLVPDTFQRYIFHLAAIMSNRNSVLLFEEPEAHSYAPYVYQLAQHIVDDDGGNQYFITTHNPYFLLPIMQEGKDVAVFATWFEDYQTHARRLSKEEIREALDYGVDMFLNLDHFIPA